MKSSSKVSKEHPQYLNDESGLVKDGHAEQIYFPETEEDIQNIVIKANEENIPITVSGGGTGISGGRVPLSGWILATDNMTTLSDREDKKEWYDELTGKTFSFRLEEKSQHEALLTVPVSMTVKAIQNLCREIGWFYPPDPTERSCFIGGNVVTNASGSRSFKYGPTRNWIEALRVILPNGQLAILNRSGSALGSDNDITIETTISSITVPRPDYSNCKATKNVAGLVIDDDSQPIDLFIGNDGLMGIITQVTLRLIVPPDEIINIFVYVDSLQQAITLAQIAQKNREEGINPIPMSVEYLDERALTIISKKEAIPEGSKALIILEQDANSEELLYDYMSYWIEQFDGLGIEHTSVAQTHQEIEYHKELRHMIPETINEIARKNGQPKLGTDYAAPLHLMDEMTLLAESLGRQFENQIYPNGLPENKFAYAIWSHFGDNHIHLNLLPTSDSEKDIAKNIMVEYMRQVVAWKGSIAAEHGLGKKVFDNLPALQLQLGFEGLQQIYSIKKSLDPLLLLNRENLLGRDLSRYS